MRKLQLIVLLSIIAQCLSPPTTSVATSAYLSTICSAYMKDTAASVKLNMCNGGTIAGACNYCDTCTAGLVTNGALTQMVIDIIPSWHFIDNDYWTCYSTPTAYPKQYTIKIADITKKAKCEELKRNWDTTVTTDCTIAAGKDFCQVCGKCATGKRATAGLSYMQKSPMPDAMWDALCEVTPPPTTSPTTTTTSPTTTTTPPTTGNSAGTSGYATVVVSGTSIASQSIVAIILLASLLVGL